MRQHFLFPVYLAFASMLTGCVLFHADFESDTVGGLPSSSPDGPPEGDEIVVWETDAENIVVFADRLFGNSLMHSYQESVSQIDFNAIETTRAVQEFTAQWDGCADRWSTDTPRYSFNIGNWNTGHANFEIEEGEFRATGERLGDVVFGEFHTVSVHVDNRAGTYTVTIAQADSTPGMEGRACSTAGGSRPACPEGFRFEGGSCRSGPSGLGYMSHCPLEGRTSCGTCRGDEVLDTMNGTCVTRFGTLITVTSTARPMGRRIDSEVSRVSIVVAYDNIVPSDPASYIMDDISIVKPGE